MHTSSSSEQAKVQWLIPAIIYTPESYTVIYGRDPVLLNVSSEVVIGTDKIKEINQIYSVSLRDLQPNTTYYYQVIATNSFGSVNSDVEKFITPPPSELINS